MQLSCFAMSPFPTTFSFRQASAAGFPNFFPLSPYPRTDEKEHVNARGVERATCKRTRFLIHPSAASQSMAARLCVRSTVHSGRVPAVLESIGLLLVYLQQVPLWAKKGKNKKRRKILAIVLQGRHARRRTTVFTAHPPHPGGSDRNLGAGTWQHKVLVQYSYLDEQAPTMRSVRCWFFFFFHHCFRWWPLTLFTGSLSFACADLPRWNDLFGSGALTAPAHGT